MKIWPSDAVCSPVVDPIGDGFRVRGFHNGEGVRTRRELAMVEKFNSGAECGITVGSAHTGPKK